MRRYRIYEWLVTGYEVIVEVVLSLAISLVLWYDEKDCTQSTRFWLQGLLACYLTHIVTRPLTGTIHLLVICILPAAVLIWIAVGTLRVLTMDSCDTYAYQLTCALLTLYWGLLGFTCLQGLYILHFSWKRRHARAAETENFSSSR